MYVICVCVDEIEEETESLEYDLILHQGTGLYFDSKEAGLESNAGKVVVVITLVNDGHVTHPESDVCVQTTPVLISSR